MSNDKTADNQREYYRIRYPDNERPQLIIGKQTFEIIDLSEKGIYFAMGSQHSYVENQALKGTVVFKSGKRCDIAGKILRTHAMEKTCALRLDRGVPLAQIMEEQRILLQKYNELKSR